MHALLVLLFATLVSGFRDQMKLSQSKLINYFLYFWLRSVMQILPKNDTNLCLCPILLQVHWAINSKWLPFSPPSWKSQTTIFRKGTWCHRWKPHQSCSSFLHTWCLSQSERFYLLKLLILLFGQSPLHLCTHWMGGISHWCKSLCGCHSIRFGNTWWMVSACWCRISTL